MILKASICIMEILLSFLNKSLPNVFPSTNRYDYRILNLSVEICYKEKNERTIPKISSIRAKENIERIIQEIGDCEIIIFFSKNKTYNKVIKKIKRNSLYEVKVVSINIYQDKSSESNSVFSYVSKTKVKTTKLQRALKVKIKRVKGASGYVVMVKNANNGKVYKIKTLKGEKKLNITIKKLKKNKRYFVLVKPFKVYKGHKYMGIATKTLRLKIK